MSAALGVATCINEIVTNLNPLLTLGYSYCSSTTVADCPTNNGNLQFQTIGIGPGTGTYQWQQSYAYDKFNRLSMASETKLASTESLATNWSQTYAFDPYGNRALMSGSYTPGANTTYIPALTSGGSMSALYPSNNQWTGATHDQHGNIMAMAGGFTMGYNLDDLMTTSTVAGISTSYQYDADGRRVSKQSGSKATIFVYDAAAALAAESSQNDTVPSDK